eukprot:CAMPEP_0117524702 /NCGR_PEP_ID=MMETSP0784-20121206/35386_1 /TAXON_ID=39447 /ORGANISM="" /LENGTH=157 /DNA_ID=CAMNT_0005320867 /DNA_START=136 /DNA_END=609 /DNA_ORIENTATION=-
MTSSPPQEPLEICQLRAELQTKEQTLESLRRGAVDHLELIQTLEREIFVKDEAIRSFRSNELAQREIAALTAELRAKDEDVISLRLKASEKEDQIKALASERKGQADLIDALKREMEEAKSSNIAVLAPAPDTAKSLEGARDEGDEENGFEGGCEDY